MDEQTKQIYDYVNKEGAKELIQDLIANNGSTEGLNVTPIDSCDFLTIEDGWYLLNNIDRSRTKPPESETENVLFVEKNSLDYKNALYKIVNVSEYPTSFNMKILMFGDYSLIRVTDQYIYVIGETHYVVNSSYGSNSPDGPYGMIKGYRYGQSEDNKHWESIYWTPDQFAETFQNDSFGFVPKTNSYDPYNKLIHSTLVTYGNGCSWSLPPLADKDYQGAIPALPNDGNKFLNGEGKWINLPLANKNYQGAIPSLPNDEDKFLNGEGNWVNLPGIPTYQSVLINHSVDGNTIRFDNHDDMLDAMIIAVEATVENTYEPIYYGEFKYDPFYADGKLGVIGRCFFEVEPDYYGDTFGLPATIDTNIMLDEGEQTLSLITFGDENAIDTLIFSMDISSVYFLRRYGSVYTP